MKILILIFALNFLLINASIVDFCSIGLGSSGSYSLFRLKQLGYSVIGFDSADFIGGHCNTIRYQSNGQNLWNEAGVVIYPDTALQNTFGYPRYLIDSKALVKLLAGNDSIIPSFFTGIPDYLAIVDIGLFIGPPPVQPPPTAEFNATLQRFRNLMNSTYRFMNTMVDPPITLPVGLNVSMNEWLVTNNFTLITSVFTDRCFYGGFGDFNQLTANDCLLQAAPIDLLYDSDPTSWFSVKNGCKSVYDGISAYLGSESIELNVNIKSVVRGDKIKIIWERNGIYQTQKCRNLIVAIPQTLDNLKFMQLDLIEEAVFSSVSTKYLFVGTFNASGGILSNLNFSLANIGLTGLPTLPNLLTNYRKFDVGPIVQQLFFPNETTLIDAENLAQSKLDNLVISGAYGSIADSDIWLHEYNPHFSREALGFPINPYYALKLIQGNRNTLYAGALPVTANTMPIWNYMENIIRNYLCKNYERCEF